MNWFCTVWKLWSHIEPFLVLFTAIAAFVLWAKGLLPVLWRLGNGLANRKIAVFASPAHLQSIRDVFEDSKLFSARNILSITHPNDVGRAEGATLFLVVWGDFKDSIDAVLSRKRDSDALIIYAPPDGGRIDDVTMAKLNAHRNTAVSNFRGRLLTDVISAMITTSYEKK